ncbi:methylmalonyl-CoA epimerase [Salibacterium salarium]|uniref:Methylmalonyl-CoA epimerase n=1 Tax=Salibacterium salarium TaxID=284579 RepID=A0A428N0W6_9BACI|nr:methylmalonyl-CoA epimerase [Salibacterium salarium]RSL32085.1 methylmalonyl-CoA epimerase [Salibacterium salarium]
MVKAPRQLDHIGIAVHSIREHCSFYEDILGLSLLKVETIPTQKVKVAFFQIGSSKIELVEPQDASSPVAKFLEKRGEGIHHIALSVSDIDQRLQDIRKTGIKTIQDHYIEGADGARTAFLHPSSTGRVLYEFIEKNDNNASVQKEDKYD